MKYVSTYIYKKVYKGYLKELNKDLQFIDLNLIMKNIISK